MRSAVSAGPVHDSSTDRASPSRCGWSHRSASWRPCAGADTTRSPARTSQAYPDVSTGRDGTERGVHAVRVTLRVRLGVWLGVGRRFGCGLGAVWGAARVWLGSMHSKEMLMSPPWYGATRVAIRACTGSIRERMRGPVGRVCVGGAGAVGVWLGCGWGA